MTEAEFKKKGFISHELMQYKSDNVMNVDGEMGGVVDCMLMGVDFEESLFKLTPIPESPYEEKDFWARCEHVNRPPRKLNKHV